METRAQPAPTPEPHRPPRRPRRYDAAFNALAIVAVVLAVAFYGRLTTATQSYPSHPYTPFANITPRASARIVATARPREGVRVVATAPPSASVRIVATAPPSTSMRIVAKAPSSASARIVATAPPSASASVVATAPPSTSVRIVATAQERADASTIRAEAICDIVTTDQQRDRCMQARLVDALTTYCAQRAINERRSPLPPSLKDYSVCARTSLAQRGG